MSKLNILLPLQLISGVFLALVPVLAWSAATVSSDYGENRTTAQNDHFIFYGLQSSEPWWLAQRGDLLLDDSDGSDSLLLDDDDSLLLDDDSQSDSLFIGEPETSESSEPAVEDTETAPAESVAAQADKLHEGLLLDNRFPSAKECLKCHEEHYKEWSVSPHAYAQLSPVFNSMSATIIKRTNGTQGDFCIRCHTPVGMILKESVFMPNSKRHPTSREGITCIVCHRVNENYGRISSRIKMVEGGILEPVYGPLGNQELKRVLANTDKYKVVTEEGARGRPIHKDIEKFFTLTTPGFCGSCHDVLFPNGFRLEDAFSEYKDSPAAKRGESCQDCHMGITPGVASGYREAPAAQVGGVDTLPRKRTNHMFVGPDYSIVHPGIYPHNSKAQALASIDEWIQFDYEAGWGTDEFEDNLADDYPFPERWDNIDDRYDARAILEDQFKLLDAATEDRLKLLRAGYKIGDIEVQKTDDSGIDFRVMVKNGTDGHGVPTGFDAERVVFLQVTVTDQDGKVVFRSGDLDPNGDIRDLHSLYVHNGELPLDEQLFSLQSKFITRNIRGSEREDVLTINYSASPLPFVRPSTLSTLLLGRPDGVRKQKQNIRSGQHLWADYHVDASALTGTGPYTANVKLIAGMVPVNLVAEIKDVGFDYGMSAREVAEKVVAGHLIVWDYDVLLVSGKVIKP